MIVYIVFFKGVFPEVCQIWRQEDLTKNYIEILLHQVHNIWLHNCEIV